MSSSPIHCLNCDTAFPENMDHSQEVFCLKCGQSNKDSKLSFARLINDAISNVLNLDSRLFHTLRDILYPSKLTRYYIEGKRKYYVNPIRLFIFTLIGLITLTLLTVEIENTEMGVDDMYARAERSKMLDDFNLLMDTLDLGDQESLKDTIKARLFENVKPIEKDTLGEDGPRISIFGDPMVKYGITTYDGMHLSQENLFKKYKIEDFWDQLYIGQHIRIMTDPAGGIKYIIKNLTWSVFITVLLISFLMKLLYIRNYYYLVEHLVLILNSHSLLFILITINILAFSYTPLGAYMGEGGFLLTLGTVLMLFSVQYLSIKKYYQQGVFKTLIKQSIINSAYLFIFVMIVILVSIISLLLY